MLEFVKIYGTDPLLKAREFVSCGAKWIHVVDIDGAFQGKTKNMEKIVEIKKINCKIQVGGGIRNIKTIENYLSSGIDRIVLGTIAIEDPDFVIETCKRFNKIAVESGYKKRLCGHSRMGKKTKVHFKEVIDFYNCQKFQLWCLH